MLPCMHCLCWEGLLKWESYYDDYNVAPLAYYDVALCYSNILQIYHCLCFRLLLSGDVELNPSPTGYRVCPQCSNEVPISSIVCISCGFVLRKGKRAGQPKCTTSQLGYNVSTGRPVGTTGDTGIVVTECPTSSNVSVGRPVGTTGSNVGTGHPIGTTRDAGSNVGTGRPICTTRDASSNVGTGRPIGTTRDAGSTGRPVGTTRDTGSNVSDGRPVGTSREEGGGTSCIEDNSVKLHAHLSQYPDLTTK